MIRYFTISLFFILIYTAVLFMGVNKYAWSAGLPNQEAQVTQVCFIQGSPQHKLFVKQVQENFKWNDKKARFEHNRTDMIALFIPGREPNSACLILITPPPGQDV